MRYYTGVGSRKTPGPIAMWMTEAAVFLRERGYVLRSGGANGADTAFETGAGSAAEVYLPWRGFNRRSSQLFPPSPAASEAARRVHPAWHRLSPGARALHARNAHQVLGASLMDPSRFVLCWTPDGAETEAQCSSETGGTATAIRIASRYGIPVFNLARPDAFVRWSNSLAQGIGVKS